MVPHTDSDLPSGAKEEDFILISELVDRTNHRTFETNRVIAGMISSDSPPGSNMSAGIHKQELNGPMPVCSLPFEP